ncbi:sporulation protein YunB [Brevibacillus formosus]|uniref:sporulation protein YunB n=1 Tax=Brevibacillus TaxID=55080 RepID=UPI000D10A4F8|nr:MULTISPECIES: sporulation protein YunB [Brevibacillus]MBG9942926.1 sporulation protein [Brevibacillus formosus]MBW5469393.1 sporulation protein YunB [Brevibacillus formosus]MED1945763.1 sporulation protein YunB [Brevibacillus formosus]MED2000604.1 sporulation protein YunB [Brevibacillus formosus]MED2084550.1 sporulation protein YunB [Brevibacillus formosus]
MSGLAVFRPRRRWRNPLSRTKAFLIAFIIFFVLTIQTLVFLQNRLEPTLLILATQKAEQLAKEAITDAVTKRISQQGVDFNQIVKIEKNNEGQIQAYQFNFKEYARIVGETTARVQNKLQEFEQEKVDRTIPLGLATGNSFLASMGPNLPVTFVPIGSVKTKLETELKEAGINMVLATVYIFVEVDLRIVIPFATEEQTITTKIPITHSLIIGDVPTYLYNNPEGKPDVPRAPGDTPDGTP